MFLNYFKLIKEKLQQKLYSEHVLEVFFPLKIFVS